MKNWKTTLAGVATIITALGNAYLEYASGGLGAVNLAVLGTAVTAGLGLIIAKDHDATGGTRE